MPYDSARRQNEDLRHVMTAWDCLTPGGTLVAVVSPGWEHPANETELLLFRCWFATIHARQKLLPEDTFGEIRTADAIVTHRDFLQQACSLGPAYLGVPVVLPQSPAQDPSLVYLAESYQPVQTLRDEKLIE
jgi:hypothetical protein